MRGASQAVALSHAIDLTAAVWLVCRGRRCGPRAVASLASGLYVGPVGTAPGDDVSSSPGAAERAARLQRPASRSRADQERRRKRRRPTEAFCCWVAAAPTVSRAARGLPLGLLLRPLLFLRSASQATTCDRSASGSPALVCRGRRRGRVGAPARKEGGVDIDITSIGRHGLLTGRT